MKKTLLAILLALALVVVPAAGVLADTTADVAVTATPGYVSITNAPDFFNFGVVLATTTPNTTEDWFTITNSSTVAMDINIKCDGWSSTGTAWLYGPAGADQGRLAASDGDAAYDVVIVAINTDYLLCNAVGTGTNPTWELQLQAPSSFTHVDVQTSTVTLTASVD